jgi:hypothetical protein
VQRLSERLGRHLERRGWLVRDAESSQLNFEPRAEDDGLADLPGHSITYRIALGAQRGRKAFTLQSLPPAAATDSTDRVAQCAGFSLHAGVAAEDSQRDSSGCAATSAARRWRSSACRGASTVASAMP